MIHHWSATVKLYYVTVLGGEEVSNIWQERGPASIHFAGKIRKEYVMNDMNFYVPDWDELRKLDSYEIPWNGKRIRQGYMYIELFCEDGKMYLKSSEHGDVEVGPYDPEIPEHFVIRAIKSCM